ncbi:hypothetical protein PBY51_004599 [Eleginops maclovinus]|uniref:Uncharacterized protein n=1 Tax=Eleginops maclovinus TaxID=56733 RepID=A0AAN8ATJ1_ELEMC|nr:hypothetical protein PBY51_004599 [Eleginops maclovinus]
MLETLTRVTCSRGAAGGRAARPPGAHRRGQLPPHRSRMAAAAAEELPALPRWRMEYKGHTKTSLRIERIAVDAGERRPAEALQKQTLSADTCSRLT